MIAAFMAALFMIVALMIVVARQNSSASPAVLPLRLIDLRHFLFLSLLLCSLRLESLELRGWAEQGGLLRGQLAEGEQLLYRGEHLPLTASGQFILGLDRDAPTEIDFSVLSGERRRYYQLAIAQRDYPTQHIDGVASHHVTPSPAQRQRTAREAASVRAARRSGSLAEDFLASFIWPADGPITGVFGSQRVYNGVPRRPHYGVDIAAPVGTTVVAPAAGRVTLAEPALFFSGGTLVVDHGHGLNSSFLHLSKLLVSVGERVEQGQRIAEIGATGRATGPHLDWRMNWTTANSDQRVDPQQLFRSPSWPLIESLLRQSTRESVQ